MSIVKHTIALSVYECSLKPEGWHRPNPEDHTDLSKSEFQVSVRLIDSQTTSPLYEIQGLRRKV